MDTLSGVVNVLKPPAMSSGGVVGAMRAVFDIKKVGHTGTLDPGAAGVLPVCLGRATKIADYIMQGEKEYIAEAAFGLATDTLDSYGVVVRSSEKEVTAADIQAVLPEFTGDIWQTPPAYSAVKHQGRPLYKLARQGEYIQKEARRVRVHTVELIGGGSNRYLLRIRCSKGTYIRTLLADMAERLGTCAYTSFLLRSETCGFRIEQAYTLDELKAMPQRENAVTPLEQALGFMRRLTLPDYLYTIVDSGAAVDLTRARINVEHGTLYRVYCRQVLVGIARRKEDDLKILTKLNQGNI